MNILKINSSSNKTQSNSRLFVEKIVEKLTSDAADFSIKERDVTYSDLTFVTDEILGAVFTRGERTASQKTVLKLADTLIEELLASDVLVIGAPMYNFTITASLKAYFDLIARVGVTFKYSENGPEGLLKNKKAYVVIATGGTAVGSAMDFSSGYIKHFLGFLGIADVEIIAVDQTMSRQKEAFAAAEAQIEKITL